MQRFVAIAAAAAEQLHFARPAKSLGLPRSVLVASVKKLEADLGYPLFVYTAETTMLRDAGEVLLKKLKIEAAKVASNATSAPPGGKAKASKGKGRAPAVKGAPRVGKPRSRRGPLVQHGSCADGHLLARS